MSKILKSIKKALKFLAYTPMQTEVFELLEDNNEGKNTENDNQQHMPNSPVDNSGSSINSDKVDYDIESNLKKINKEFNVPTNNDVTVRELNIARKIRGLIVYVEGMTDRTVVNDTVLRQLMRRDCLDDYTQGSPIDYIAYSVLPVNRVRKTSSLQDIIMQTLTGMTALFIEGCNECLLIETKGYEKRKVDKPTNEIVIGGSQEGFTEDLRTNLTLIRRIIRNKNLITEMLPVGKTNNTRCAILYLNGIVNPAVVDEVKRRIKNIDTDYINGEGMLAQYMVEDSFAFFPQYLSTERPDRTASFIMEGKVSIIAEGAPFAEVVPVTFFHMFHTSEDSSIKWQFGTFLRFIRLFGFFVSILLPGVYLALNLYRQELIPTELLSAIAESRERVPFPLAFELIMMEMGFELIREAGLRVPGVVGNTLGIIGALILGQAAVAANLVSPILIIVVALSGLGNFSMPNYQLALGIRITRFVFIALGGIAGFYGIFIGIFVIGGLMCHMKSFGVPFLSPVAPKMHKSKDLIIRHPLWKDETRTDVTNAVDIKRQPHKSRKWLKKSSKGDEK